MSPQLFYRLTEMPGRCVRRQSRNWSVCQTRHCSAWLSQHSSSSNSIATVHSCNCLGSSFDWDRSKYCASMANRLSNGTSGEASTSSKESPVSCRSPGFRFLIARKVPPGKPQAYGQLIHSSGRFPDFKSIINQTLHKRNRSLVPKSRERSDRQGGRWGDKHRRYITCH